MHLFILSNNAFKCCNSFKTLTYWYKLVIASYTLNAILCKRVPCGKISLTLIYFFDVWVVSSWCNQNTQWKTALFYQRTKLQTSYLLQTYGFPPNMATKDVTFVKRGMVFYVTELVCVPFILRDRSFILYQREIFVDKLSDLIWTYFIVYM